MDQLFRYPLQQIPLVAMAIIIALSVHEFAHAYVAYKFGDDTAKKQGRLTLSPMAHLDPIGMIAVLILGFGWARPVPVNPYNFKRPRLAGILVSIAGPISNLILSAIGLIIWYSLITFGVLDAMPLAVADTLDLIFPKFLLCLILFYLYLIYYQSRHLMVIALWKI